MGLNNYPYTNFHEMNLDWILEAFGKEVYRIEQLEEWQTEAGQDISELQSQEAQLRGYITALQTAQDYINGRLTIDENSIVQLRTDVNDINDDIDSISDDITAINSWRTTTNATLINYGTRIVTIEEFIEDMAEGSLPQALIDSLMEYVRTHLPELLTPIQSAITSLQTDMTLVQQTLPTKLNAGTSTVEASANNITTAGQYLIDLTVTSGGLPLQTNGTLLVFRSSGNSTGNITQIFISTAGNMYSRFSAAGTSWSVWQSYVTSIGELQTAVNNLNASVTSLQSSVTALDNLGLTVPIPFNKGGTNATSRANASQNITSLGINNITLIEGTSAEIRTLGYSTSYYDTSSYSGSHSELIPHSYGILISYVSNYESGWYAIDQYFYEANSTGTYYHRHISPNSTPNTMQFICSRTHIKLYYNETSLSALTPTRLTISNRDIYGNDFGIYAIGTDHVILPKGTYRISLHYVNNPGSNGILRMCLKQGTQSSTFVASDKCYATGTAGTLSTLVALNSSDIIALTENTTLYFVVQSQNTLSSGGYATMIIDRL